MLLFIQLLFAKKFSARIYLLLLKHDKTLACDARWQGRLRLKKHLNVIVFVRKILLFVITITVNSLVELGMRKKKHSGATMVEWQQKHKHNVLEYFK